MISRVGCWTNSRQRGFTLVELLIALVVIGLLMGLVVGQVGKLLDREMKHAASRLGSTIRYLYNKAASDGVTFRLVLDMDEHKYWVESTAEQFALIKEEKEFFAKKAEKKEQATFSPQESYLLKPVNLPKGIYFKDVYAEHQIERLDTGQAFIHFFARGYVERSIINLRDSEDEVHFSLAVNPVTGAVKIAKGYQEPEIER